MTPAGSPFTDPTPSILSPICPRPRGIPRPSASARPPPASLQGTISGSHSGTWDLFLFLSLALVTSHSEPSGSCSFLIWNDLCVSVTGGASSRGQGSSWLMRPGGSQHPACFCACRVLIGMNPYGCFPYANHAKPQHPQPPVKTNFALK